MGEESLRTRWFLISSRGPPEAISQYLTRKPDEGQALPVSLPLRLRLPLRQSLALGRNTGSQWQVSAVGPPSGPLAA
jgi:hypothetical protein